MKLYAETIETPRLIIRACKIEDAEDVFSYAASPEVGPNAGWKPHETIEETRSILNEWIAGSETDVIWIVEEKSTGKAVGTVGIHSDDRRPNVPDCKMLGYVLSKECWGKGYMTEAAKAVIDYAFKSLRLKILSVNHYTFNQRSQRVIEKCGFQFEGIMRRAAAIYNGHIVDACFYSMTSAEYRLIKAKEAGLSLKLSEAFDKNSILSYLEEWGEGDISPYSLNLLANMDYDKWQSLIVTMRTNAPENLVNSTLYLLVDKNEEPIGAIELRHELNQNLLNTGGHIGYGIRPQYRGRGYASLMLALALEKAKEIGISKALVTCNDDNPASAATIEACGGELENKFSEEDGNLVRRYWISI